MSIFKRRKVVVFDKQTALKVLRELIADLQQLNIKCWLTDGTLLGYYREKDFISHDLDMDVGVFIKDYHPKVDKHLVTQGWTIVRKLGFRDLGLELTLSKDDHNIDIFFFYEEGDNYWHAAWQGKRKKGVRYRRMIKYSYNKFTLKQATFLGLEVLVPENCKLYIETKYGQDWRTPIKNWDWALGPANAVATDIEIPQLKRR